MSKSLPGYKRIYCLRSEQFLQFNNENFYDSPPPKPHRQPRNWTSIAAISLFLIVFLCCVTIYILGTILPFLPDEFPIYPQSTELSYSQEALKDTGLDILSLDAYPFGYRQQKAFTTTASEEEVRYFYQKIGTERNNRFTIGDTDDTASKIENLNIVFFRGESFRFKVPTNVVIMLNHDTPTQNDVIKAVFPTAVANTNVVIIFRGYINIH